MRRFIFILLSLWLIQPSFAQSQAEMKKMMEDAKKAISGAEDMDPALQQGLMKMMDKQSGNMKNYTPPKFAPGEVSFEVPMRDNARLSALPSTALTDGQLTSSVQSIASKIEKQLPQADLKDAQSILSKAKGSSLYISTEAAGAWYNGYLEKALYLAATASALKDNNNALNNLGAMLNLYGYEEKAVPILLYLSKKLPGNPDVLNNLGRAYLGMGATDKAETIFLSCIAIAPTHPEANTSLGCLYESKGEKEKAAEHFEKSIEGAMTEVAIDRLQKSYPQRNIVTQMRKHYQAPEYFNQFKFQIPQALTNKEDYYKVDEMHKAFRKSISDLSKKYNAMALFSEKKSEEEHQAEYNNLLKAVETSDMSLMKISSMPPFTVAAARMQLQLALYFDEVSHRFKNHYQQSIRELSDKRAASNKKISEEYDALKVMGEMGECGYCCINCEKEKIEEKKCLAIEKNNIQYQADAAGVFQEFADKYRLLLTGFYDDDAYWNALSGLSDHDKDIQFYNMIIEFLSEIEYISNQAPFLVGPDYCNGDQAPDFDAKKEPYDTIKKPDCPLSLKLPFIIGKLSLDCTSFSIAGGEGVKLGYKKSSKTGQSTLTIGAGITLETPGKLASASVNADGNFYVTIDKDGSFMDVGVKFDAGAGIQSKGVNTKSGLGYTLGMNSGWGFTATSAGQTLKL